MCFTVCESIKLLSSSSVITFSFFLSFDCSSGHELVRNLFCSSDGGWIKSGTLLEPDDGSIVPLESYLLL